MEVIILFIIISLLTLVLFLALKKLIDNITNDSKEYYFKKAQDYDDQLFAKEQQLQALEPSQIDKNINQENKEESVRNAGLDKDFLKTINNTDYETGNALKIANRVDEIFQIDEEKIIKDFLANCEFNDNYRVYEQLQARFSPNLIYKLRMLNRDGQISVLSKLLSDTEYEVFNAYVSTRKFKLHKFLLDLDSVVKNNQPWIEVIVGNHSKNYDYLSPYIKTTYSDEIYKGFIIKYQDRIYDYSINERDV